MLLPATLFLIGLLAVGGLADLTTRRIPNALISAVAVSGAINSLLTYRLLSALTQIAIAIALGVILTVPWRARMLGAGDVKLVAATAIWLPPIQLAVFLGTTAIAGGVLSLAACAAGLLHHPMQSSISPSIAVQARALLKGKIPYGVAIAVGGTIAVLTGR